MLATRQKRHKKLPKPAFQLKLIGVFLGLGVACAFVQFALLSRSMTQVAIQAPEGEILLGLVGDLLWKHLLITLGLLIPLTASIGILVTFRIAGPLHRFETHLRSVIAGHDPGPLKLREGDELVELSHLINQVIEDGKEARSPAVDFAETATS